MEELSYATEMCPLSTGKLDTTKVVQDVTLGSFSRGMKYRKSLESVSESTLSSDALVSLIVEQEFHNHSIKLS